MYVLNVNILKKKKDLIKGYLLLHCFNYFIIFTFNLLFNPITL